MDPPVGDPTPFSKNLAGIDGRDHRAAFALLAEGQGLGISRIGVLVRIPGPVVVAKECMLETRCFDFGCIEWCMGLPRR